ncbi:MULTISPECIES: FAD-binding protein [Lactobacillus]|uniref:FAD-binding protein n=1 Tax=Lactobacillus TaxID=1578 RepID=UPI001C699435|nr:MULTISPECIES: FAD-binding protein [Lactobacillus]MCX8722054.1 FAD-binding protein [Lactobacillus sp. B4010]MCX8732692.1 FAD-binding protein [Lactobacillus sp. B4015]MCX8734912.1 FAD-binding protein [Lactobacillus sp. B4012]QYN57525.1 FAD-binding protein [Lactobacillus panisapium]
MIVNKNTYYDASYDVIVLGFGGAGATAARFAADCGAKVLIVDSAPEGHEGGNTRYAAELVGYSSNESDYRDYYEHLAQHFNIDPEIENTVVHGITHMKEYFKKYLGIDKPVSYKTILGLTDDAVIADHPDLPGAKSYDMITIEKGIFNASLWNILRQNVLDRSDMIDVWYSSPVVHLLQTPDKKVIGAQIERDHVLLNVYAKNGVVLSTGGIENNPQMIQDYIGSNKLVPLGSLYNKGKGIDLAHEAGADMWHMSMYAAGGMQQSFAFYEPKMKRAPFYMGNPIFFTGSIFTVGDDGTRYFKEDQIAREGYIENHGSWYKPLNPIHPYFVFDQKQYDKINAIDSFPDNKALNSVIKAESIASLAEKMDVEAGKLQNTVDEFNFFAEKQHDYAFHRAPETMSAFSKSGPYYAVPLVQTIGWSEAGPRRNARAEILDPDHKPIPHLYGAGELGSNMSNLYQGGSDLGDCLIFGKIAGQNAAHPKDDIEDACVGPVKNEKPKKHAMPRQITSDLKKEEFSTGPDQYIGKSTKGMGDEIVVRVTADKQKNLKNIEVLKQAESDDYGQKAINELPHRMVKENTVDVDAISGASNTTRGLKEAVRDALNKIK